MERKHYFNRKTRRYRTITRVGDGVRVKLSQDETEIPESEMPSPKDLMSRRLAVRDLSITSQVIAHREVLKRIPLQKLIDAAIEQGLFDRLMIDG